MRTSTASLPLLPPPDPGRPAEERAGRYPMLLPANAETRASSRMPPSIYVQERTDVVQAQRDGLLRLRERLLSTIRDLEQENRALRLHATEQGRHARSPREAEEAREAHELERELNILFHRMPQNVYPGRPYVTQQELISRGITKYTRQNISRLARDGETVPAVVIADRVLLPPEGVRALVERERVASRDRSPRRRPGGKGRKPPIRE